ncbi:stress-response A/B barrel domain-containing protein HS1 [Vitis vinifera]|uniref:stress-response A/B barrel domain-containing protein HS1 n=1 Tax=Vitis vinifera TaxID=29760 RepID=UPI0001983352|nr:stress-response A/B barrel domain-containing protein HS1 [Vitis vinifera]|eukprot:XP_019075360.1 PREDICTED: stress-response A/B barrel domain-containing protein HS1 [Vitis vinifera]
MDLWQGERLRVSLYHRVEWKREEGKGVVKHVLLAKFKDSTPPDQIEELIKSYANLVSLIPPMKAFHWGKDVSIENMHQGFTHVFESTFESVEGMAEYVSHPAHVEAANRFLPHLEKVIVLDYKPTAVHL